MLENSWYSSASSPLRTFCSFQWVSHLLWTLHLIVTFTRSMIFRLVSGAFFPKAFFREKKHTNQTTVGRLLIPLNQICSKRVRNPFYISFQTLCTRFQISRIEHKKNWDDLARPPIWLVSYQQYHVLFLIIASSPYWQPPQWNQKEFILLNICRKFIIVINRKQYLFGLGDGGRGDGGRPCVHAFLSLGWYFFWQD